MTVYRYICSNNHELRSPEPRDACVGSIDGVPCDGVLRQITGAGMGRSGWSGDAQHQPDRDLRAWPNAS